MFNGIGVLLVGDRRSKALAALIVVASAGIVGLMSASVARDDAGVRQFWLRQAESGSAVEHSSRAEDTAAPQVPLTIRTERPRPRHSVPVRALASLERSTSLPRPKPRLATVRSVKVLSADIFGAAPPRPAVVSLYADRTLRRGDAVMTEVGMRVFAGSRTFPYRPEDFTTLAASRTLNGQVRRALIELDQLPMLRG